ncbi:MAG: hypothetical protein KAR05_12095 [Candidatus Omnitrophica bacterium]|nr:hypothetical protein [Candidatus Omnitrophota bacterium]
MNVIYDKLKSALRAESEKNSLLNESVRISCKALTAKQAIGTPRHDDYPIIKGKEVMVEADFRGSKGQAFSDSFEQITYCLNDLLSIDLNANARRASFIAGLNAVYRSLGLCEKTIHCRDTEPEQCADNLLKDVQMPEKILMIGFQPRFINVLSENRHIRVIDLDKDNIGKNVNGVIVEAESGTDEALKWCDMVFATGSTIVNGTIARFINQPKPAIFYGVTISAAGQILGLKTCCSHGH